MSHDAPQSFWRHYVFSTDHKMIAKQYMITGLVMALLGGFLAYGFRWQQAWPGSVVPGVGVVDPRTYNTMVTMHGTIMVFWVAMPVLLAAFGNLLLPLMVGAEDMAFPRLNMLSYWIFLTSALLLVASFFVPGGASGNGWTGYPPLMSRPAYNGVYWGGHMWILAVALEFVAFLMGGINFVTTVINRRVPGLTMWRLPIFVWEEIIAAIVFMLSVGPLVAGAVMLLLDRMAGTSFYIPEQGGDPLLFEHLFWFFGHPEVYVLLLPSMGLVAEVLTCHSRKALFGYKMIVWATVVAGVLSFVVWAHHQFVSGLDPKLGNPFSLTTILISVPFAVSIFAFLATLWGGSIRFTTAMLFALGFMGLFLIGGVTGIVNGTAASDIFVHDSYFVVAHFHFALVPVTFLGFFAGIYHYYPKLYGKMLNEPLGVLHFLGTCVGTCVTFIPQFKLGLMGMHRRIPDPTAYEFLKDGQGLHQYSTYGLLILLASQLPFIFNFFYSMANGKVAGRNPWNATTLEWNTESPPPHGNFDTPQVVYHDPYVYSRDGDKNDFTPQNAPEASTAPVPQHA
jgi:cytochrome c oxidase subunit I